MVFDAIPAITEYTSLYGITPTHLMEELLGDLAHVPAAPREGPEAQPGSKVKRKQKPLEELLLTDQRAVWLNHDGVTLFRRQQQAQKINEAETAKAQAEAQRTADLQKKQDEKRGEEARREEAEGCRTGDEEGCASACKRHPHSSKQTRSASAWKNSKMPITSGGRGQQGLHGSPGSFDVPILCILSSGRRVWAIRTSGCNAILVRSGSVLRVSVRTCSRSTSPNAPKKRREQII